MPKTDTIALKLDRKLRTLLQEMADDAGASLPDFIETKLREAVLDPEVVLKRLEKRSQKAKPVKVSVYPRRPRKEQ